MFERLFSWEGEEEDGWFEAVALILGFIFAPILLVHGAARSGLRKADSNGLT